MIYYQDDRFVIRDLTTSDAYVFTEEEIKQGWHQNVDKYLKRIEDRDNNLCVSLVCLLNNKVAGYINLYHHSNKGPKSLQGLPEIVDFGVLEKYRRNGVGALLMNVIEKIAKKYADKVYLSVGLHKGYGSAQRMYVKRGYIPDGTGLWYKDAICEPYSNYANDDDLQMYLYKKI